MAPLWMIYENRESSHEWSEHQKYIKFKWYGINSKYYCGDKTEERLNISINYYLNQISKYVLITDKSKDFIAAAVGTAQSLISIYYIQLTHLKTRQRMGGHSDRDMRESFEEYYLKL